MASLQLVSAGVTYLMFAIFYNFFFFFYSCDFNICDCPWVGKLEVRPVYYTQSVFRALHPHRYQTGSSGCVSATATFQLTWMGVPGHPLCEQTWSSHGAFMSMSSDSHCHSACDSHKNRTTFLCRALSAYYLVWLTLQRIHKNMVQALFFFCGTGITSHGHSYPCKSDSGKCTAFYDRFLGCF